MGMNSLASCPFSVAPFPLQPRLHWGSSPPAALGAGPVGRASSTSSEVGRGGLCLTTYIAPTAPEAHRALGWGLCIFSCEVGVIVLFHSSRD